MRSTSAFPYKGATMAQPDANADSARAAIARYWRADEAECLPPLIAAARLEPPLHVRTEELARGLIEGMRRGSHRYGVEALLRALPLGSPGGLALLSLAESLLRVPDAANADRLVRERLSGTSWQASDGGAAWSGVLTLASALVRSEDDEHATGTLAGVLSRLGTPLVRRALLLSLRGLSGHVYFQPDHTRGPQARAPRDAAALPLFLRYARRGGGDRGGRATLFAGL